METLNRLFSLKNKHIIIGGGCGQIGSSMASIVANSGALVSVIDIDIEMGLEKFKNKNNINIYKCDVSNKKEVNNVFKKIRKDIGQIDGLVNCFHYKGDTRKLNVKSNFFSTFSNYEEQAWDNVHNVNLKGSFLTSQAVIPYFEESRKGVIVNVSSTYGIVSPNKNIYGDSGINSPVAYATSKSAIIQLSKYLATHLAEKNIRVNTLSPGGVFNNQSSEFIKNYEKLTPLGRMATVRDYDGPIVFLLSDSSSYMTGSNLVVDGGWTAW